MYTATCALHIDSPSGLVQQRPVSTSCTNPGNTIGGCQAPTFLIIKVGLRLLHQISWVFVLSLASPEVPSSEWQSYSGCLSCQSAEVWVCSSPVLCGWLVPSIALVTMPSVPKPTSPHHWPILIDFACSFGKALSNNGRDVFARPMLWWTHLFTLLVYAILRLSFTLQTRKLAFPKPQTTHQMYSIKHHQKSPKMSRWTLKSGSHINSQWRQFSIMASASVRLAFRLDITPDFVAQGLA